MSNVEELQEELDDLGGRFRIKKVLGQGSYGMVFKAIDERNKEAVALKRIHKDIMKERELATRVLREIKLLQHFEVPNVLHLKHLLLSRSDNVIDCLYLVTDVMETDLKSLLSSNQVLTIDHVSYLTHQLLRGLKSLHSAGVVHRDLTPGNILVNTKDCELKIADLGLAREIPDDGLMTDYVTVRWYRAPEVLCDSSHYDSGVDMWAVGCIFGELLGSKPLFPGTNKANQLERIILCLGPPTVETLRSMEASQKCKEYVRKRPPSPKAPLSSRINGPNCTPATMDMLSKLLVFNPKERMSVDDALLHPVLQEQAEEEGPVRYKVGPFLYRIPSRSNTAYITNEIVKTQTLMMKGFRDSTMGAALTAALLIASISKFTRMAYWDLPAKITIGIDPHQQGVAVQRSGDTMCPRSVLADLSTNFELAVKTAPDSKWSSVTAALSSFATHELQTVRHKQLTAQAIPLLPLRSALKGHFQSKSMDLVRDVGSDDTPGREALGASSSRTNPLQSAFSSYKSPTKKTPRGGQDTPVTESTDEDDTANGHTKNPSQPTSVPCTPVHTRTRSAGDAIVSTALVSPCTSKRHKRINSQLPASIVTPKPQVSPISHQELLNKLTSDRLERMQQEQTDPLKWGNEKLAAMDISRRPAALEELTFEDGDDDYDEVDITQIEEDRIETPAAPRKRVEQKKVLPACAVAPGVHIIPPPVELIDARSGRKSMLGVSPSTKALIYSSGARPAVVKDITYDAGTGVLMMPGIRKGVVLQQEAAKAVLQEVSKLAHVAGVNTDLARDGQVMNASLTKIKNMAAGGVNTEVTPSFVAVSCKGLLNMRNSGQILAPNAPIKSVLRHSNMVCVSLRICVVSYVFSEMPVPQPQSTMPLLQRRSSNVAISAAPATPASSREDNADDSPPRPVRSAREGHEPFESHESSETDTKAKCKCSCQIS